MVVVRTKRAVEIMRVVCSQSCVPEAIGGQLRMPSSESLSVSMVPRTGISLLRSLKEDQVERKEKSWVFLFFFFLALF